MTSWKLVGRSISFYWRTHLGVLLGVALCTAILVGALAVGDSVRYTLKTMALERLGEVNLALTSNDRYFDEGIATYMPSDLNAEVAAVLQVYGVVANSDGSARVNQAQVSGVDEHFWSLLNDGKQLLTSGDGVIVNRRLADHISVSEGDDILIRVKQTSFLPGDAPMSIADDLSVAIRATVETIIPDSGAGRFSLHSSQIPSFNVFMPIEQLQNRLDLIEQANMLLVGGDNPPDAATADSVLRKHLKLRHIGLELRAIPEQEMYELRSKRVFLDPPVADAAFEAAPETTKILTYFVNEIQKEDRTTPYSMVSATDPPLLDMPDDGILINSWLAEDLNAKVGDTLKITYLAFGLMRNLEKRTDSFRVHAVLPMEGAALDPDLMPDFPGLSGAENCRDWEPGIEIDLDKIRDKDEEYWDQYRGTPKAFIKLEAGQRMWRNRFGDLTAVRFPYSNNSHTSLEMAIRDNLDPASVGLFFQPVREQALKSSAEGVDFGQLFLGLSFFLIASAVLLTGLLFVFGIQQRTEEIGTLMAVGFPSRQVRNLFMLEGGVLALIGGLMGVAGGILYTRITLFALSGVWGDAVQAVNLYYHARPLTLLMGGLIGMMIALLTIWVASFRQAKHPARELLTTSGEFEWKSVSKRGYSSIRAVLIFLISLALIISALVILIMSDTNSAGAFFAAGGLLLVGGLGLSHILLTRLSSLLVRSGLMGMGMRNSSRRWGRSLTTIGLLACGCFLVIAVGANRHDATKNADKRWSGTGGFALYGETVVPVLHDLNGEKGRGVYDLDSEILKDVKFVQLRVHEGEDASCLNLNRAQTPRLMGIRPEEFQKRGAFTISKKLESINDPWASLLKEAEGNTVNSIADQETITWAIGKSVGDTLTYRDERGKELNVRLTGAIASSILQGSLMISEDEFIRRFPSESGYRVFLIDAPSNRIDEISRELTRAMQDVGLELTPAAKRLGEFNSVQNTYLSIFQSLGGLALLLGSLGLGIVVLRNVMERRGELALLRAVGFRKSSLQWLVFSEHWILLVLGMICGVVSGIVAVIPALRSPGADIPYVSLTITLLAILINGAVWVWLATRLALGGRLLNALRNE